MALRVAVGREARQQEARQSRRPSARARGTRRTSAPRRTTCGRRARRAGPRRPHATGVARVVLARTSEPPCFSVIPMPIVLPALLPRRHRSRVVRRRERCAAATRARAPAACSSDGTHAYVIVSGQLVPWSAWLCRYISAARATCAPLRPTRVRHAKLGHAVLDAELHEPVIRRMELDLVDAIARSGRTRGASGGFSLAATPSAISSPPAIDAVGGDLPPRPTRRPRARAPRAAAGRWRTRRRARAVAAGSRRCGSGKARVS